MFYCYLYVRVSVVEPLQCVLTPSSATLRFAIPCPLESLSVVGLLIPHRKPLVVCRLGGVWKPLGRITLSRVLTTARSKTSMPTILKVVKAQQTSEVWPSVDVGGLSHRLHPGSPAQRLDQCLLKFGIIDAEELRLKPDDMPEERAKAEVVGIQEG